MKKTTIRMSLTPSEVEASLELIESLPEGSTINRTFSSCIEQLFRAFLTTATNAKGIQWLTEAEASKALIARKEKLELNLNSVPMEEISLMEDKAAEIVKDERMEKIRQTIAENNIMGEVETSVEYPAGGKSETEESSTSDDGQSSEISNA